MIKIEIIIYNLIIFIILFINMENENKQEYYTKTITTIGKKVDECKIIKEVSKDTYLNTKNL